MPLEPVNDLVINERSHSKVLHQIERMQLWAAQNPKARILIAHPKKIPIHPGIKAAMKRLRNKYPELTISKQEW